MARVAVIGAGIVGVATATWLIDAGHAVSLIEHDPEGLPTSSGNAALLALPEIAPMASLGLVTTVPRWLMDPLGPLTVRWPDLPALMPWLLSFLKAANPSQERRSRGALTGMMQTALADHERMGSVAGLDNHLRQSGYISVHDNERNVTKALMEAALVKKLLHFDFERLTPEQARKLVPQLEGPFAGAVHQPGYWMVTNPLTVLRQYQKFVRTRGELVTDRVTGIQQRGEDVAVRCGVRVLSFDYVVVAAGIWSRDLVRKMGLKVLLETERGYNTTYENLDWNLPMPVGFGDHGFVASPLIDGLRVGGAVELAKPDTNPNYARAKAMVAKMRRYVPSLPEDGKEWMGRRPSTPDSLPVIGHHPQDRRVLFAFGHGHLGLTLSATTGRMIVQLVSGENEDPAFSIKRFN